MSDLLYKADIRLIQQNIRGAWVIYGAAGVRQYYGYTKEQAKELYLKECKKNLEVKK